jgi:DNA repair ATPase RecN
MRVSRLLWIVASVCTLPVLAQSGGNAGDDRLRNQLKQTTLELRAAREQLAGLKAENEALKAVAAAVVAKPAPVAPVVDSRTVRALEAKTRELDAAHAELATARQTQQKWELAYREAADVARQRDGELRRLGDLATQAAAFEKSCTAKNHDLVQISQQVLDRYRDKGVFASLVASEPLTGLAKVRYENLAQEFAGKIADQRLPEVPLEAAPVPPPPSP